MCKIVLKNLKNKTKQQPHPYIFMPKENSEGTESNLALVCLQ